MRDEAKILRAVLGLKKGTKLGRHMNSNYPTSHSDFRKQIDDLVHRTELLASRLGETNEGTEQKRSRRSEGQCKAPGNFKPFEDPVTVKLIEVFDTSPGYIYT